MKQLVMDAEGLWLVREDGVYERVVLDAQAHEEETETAAERTGTR